MHKYHAIPNDYIHQLASDTHIQVLPHDDSSIRIVDSEGFCTDMYCTDRQDDSLWEDHFHNGQDVLRVPRYQDEYAHDKNFQKPVPYLAVTPNQQVVWARQDLTRKNAIKMPDVEIVDNDFVGSTGTTPGGVSFAGPQQFSHGRMMVVPQKGSIKERIKNVFRSKARNGK